MSLPISLEDILKGLPKSSIPVNDSVVMTDASGQLCMKPFNRFLYNDIYTSEPKDTELTLKEYIVKYIQPHGIGEAIAINRYEFASMFYLRLTSSVRINLQYYYALITKNYLTVNSAWGLISFMLFPSGFEAENIYVVTYYSTSNPANPTIRVRKLSMDTLTS